MWTRQSMVAVFAWILWMDQSAYVVPDGPTDTAPRQVEGARSQWQQIAITQSRGECRALKRAQVLEAARRDEEQEPTARAGRGKYREQYRYFCSPVVDDPRK